MADPGRAEEAFIRAERPEDAPAVRRVHLAAFGRPDEADLVERLRLNRHAVVSLVAEAGGEVVGHLLFSPVTIDGAARGNGVALAPVAVLPAFQRRGIGAGLVYAGLNVCRASGNGFAVLRGEPQYYRRFGFRPAAERKLVDEYGSGSAFMVMELVDGALPPGGGLVRYTTEFSELGDGNAP